MPDHQEGVGFAGIVRPAERRQALSPQPGCGAAGRRSCPNAHGRTSRVQSGAKKIARPTERRQALSTQHDTSEEAFVKGGARLLQTVR